MVVKVILKIVVIAISLGLIILILPRLITVFYSRPRLFSVDKVPNKPVAIVFGAGLWRDGTPTKVLQDRIDTVAMLYFAGKVQKILMSGDNRFVDYNEPGAMQEYALSLGIPAEAIVLDYAGRRTYDTCYRAKAIFGLREAILITQGFHIPRALYTCNALGLKSVGVASDHQKYRLSSQVYWNLRELPATLAALLDVHIFRTEPVLGAPEPIFQDTGQ